MQKILLDRNSTRLTKESRFKDIYILIRKKYKSLLT